MLKQNLQFLLEVGIFNYQSQLRCLISRQNNIFVARSTQLYIVFLLLILFGFRNIFDLSITNEVLLTENGVNTSDIRSFEVQPKMTRLSEKYVFLLPLLFSVSQTCPHRPPNRQKNGFFIDMWLFLYMQKNTLKHHRCDVPPVLYTHPGLCFLQYLLQETTFLIG